MIHFKNRLNMGLKLKCSVNVVGKNLQLNAAKSLKFLDVCTDKMVCFSLV